MQERLAVKDAQIAAKDEQINALFNLFVLASIAGLLCWCETLFGTRHPFEHGVLTHTVSGVWKSIRFYIGCLITLGAMWFYVLSHAPPPPAIEECDNFGLYAVITVGKDPTALSRMITCAQAYQRYNWWFVVCTFFLTYIGIKMFAIPAVFPLGILGGAIFPFWLSLFLTASGEALGNSLCYLMSASIAQPVLERLFPQKLAKVAQKAEEEKVSGCRQHLLCRPPHLHLRPTAATSPHRRRLLPHPHFHFHPASTLHPPLSALRPPPSALRRHLRLHRHLPLRPPTTARITGCSSTSSCV